MILVVVNRPRADPISPLRASGRVDSS